jgi:hypothetical protein
MVTTRSGVQAVQAVPALQVRQQAQKRRGTPAKQPTNPSVRGNAASALRKTTGKKAAKKTVVLAVPVPAAGDTPAPATPAAGPSTAPVAGPSTVPAPAATPMEEDADIELVSVKTTFNPKNTPPWSAKFTATGNTAADGQAITTHSIMFTQWRLTADTVVPEHLRDVVYTGVFMNSLFDAEGYTGVADFKAEICSSLPFPPIDELVARTVARFAAEVRSLSDVARDKLYSRAYRMTGNFGQYVSSYRAIMGRIPDMSEHDRIRWFVEGLTPALQTECLVDSMGEEFADLDSLIHHATVEARKLAVKSAHAARSGSSAPASSPRFNRFKPRVAAIASGSRTQARKRSLAQAADSEPVTASVSAKRPATGNRAPGRGSGPNRGGGRGGRGGRGTGNRNGNATPYDKLALSGIHDPVTGRRLTFAEVEQYKKAGICFNCLNREHPHHSKDCPKPKKQFRDGRVNEQGEVVPHN